MLSCSFTTVEISYILFPVPKTMRVTVQILNKLSILVNIWVNGSIEELLILVFSGGFTETTGKHNIFFHGGFQLPHYFSWFSTKRPCHIQSNRRVKVEGVMLIICILAIEKNFRGNIHQSSMKTQGESFCLKSQVSSNLFESE